MKDSKLVDSFTVSMHSNLPANMAMQQMLTVNGLWKMMGITSIHIGPYWIAAHPECIGTVVAPVYI